MWLPHCGQCFRVDGIRDAVRDVANGVGVRSRQTTAMLDVATALRARPVWRRGGSQHYRELAGASNVNR